MTELIRVHTDIENKRTYAYRHGVHSKQIFAVIVIIIERLILLQLF